MAIHDIAKYIAIYPWYKINEVYRVYGGFSILQRVWVTFCEAQE